jgi:glycosyltransferase involved in cell wall biosynthesis
MSRSAPLSRPAPLSASLTAPGALSSQPRWRHVLIGDAQSPHLLKWARALAPQVELWVASSRGFAAGFDGIVPSWRRLALGAEVAHSGDNLALIKRLPELARWLKEVDADWIHPHYLTSHGTLAWAAKLGWRLRGQLVASAWGSDILVTPHRHAAYRWVTRRVLRASRICTSDSQHMAAEMRALGADEVRVFPFGLERMPPPPAEKDPELYFSNRGLEPIYKPERVIASFAAIAAVRPAARLIVANDGSLRDGLQAQTRGLGVADRVKFVGRLDATAQDHWYARAQWYFSLPESDSVAVSVLEAMAHGCIPILSDLPANHELVRSGDNGLILANGCLPKIDALYLLADLGRQAPRIAHENRNWVLQHGLFAPAVSSLLTRLRELTPPIPHRPEPTDPAR